MVSFAEYEAGYLQNWASLQIRPNIVAEAQKQAKRLLQGKSTYQVVESKSGVPWWFVGLCHYRESNYNFNTYLGNGQPLNQRTTIVPLGRGPFTGPTAFVDGALDALRIENFVGATDWGIARVLFRLEGFNGYGYHGFGVNSPYLYGGSTCYGPPEARGGKYVADHDFNPNVFDTQLGTAVILKSLMALDSSISFGAATSPTQDPAAQPDDELAKTILWVQQALNKLGANPQLVEDGKNGPLTMAAVSQFQQQHILPNTGLADAATIAAIGQLITPDATPTSGTVFDTILQRLAQLEKISGVFANPSVSQITGTGQVSTNSNDLTALLQGLLAIVQRAQGQGSTVQTPNATQSADQVKKAADFLNLIIAPGGANISSLPVTNALGTTIGNLLDGKKTAIGIFGALATSLLSFATTAAPVVAGATGAATAGATGAASGAAGLSALGQILAPLIPAAGLSGYAMPIFLAMTAWGVLSKMEKWTKEVQTK